MPRHEKLLAGLNPEQRAAVCQTEGPVLILAGAGSGKTRVITTRIAYILAERLADPSQILAVTFTNKAAEEMRDRVAGVIGRGLAKDVVMSTFHSFCVRVLRQQIEHLGYRRNFTISTEGDARTLLRRALSDLEGVDESFDPGMFLERIGMRKSTGLGNGEEEEEELPPDEEESETEKKYRTWLPEIYERYQSALRAANSVDFDDLLLLTLRLWKEHPRILARYQSQYRYVMVDEYQDTNRVQYELVKALVQKHRNVCVVGDDDQSIYSWRGADIRNILSLEQDFPEAKVIKLEQNYRSTSTILNAANSVIANNQARRPKKLWSALGEGRRIDWIVTGEEEHEAKEAVKWLQHIQSRSGARYRDFLILYRSNQQSRPFEIALRQAQIPYVVVGGQEFFERAEIRDIVAYLKVIANPRDEAAFLRIVNMPRRGIGDVTLHQLHDLCLKEKLSLGKGLAELLRRGGLNQSTEAGIRQFLGLLSEFRRRFREHEGTLTSTVADLIDAIGYRPELYKMCKSSAQFESRWSNVEALTSAVAHYEEHAEKTSLSTFLDECSLVSDGDRRDRENKKASGVTLMTVHSAKGLEAPFVFIVGAEDGLLPHEKSVSEAALEEERRLFYVAITRAKRHLTIFESLSRERYGRARMTKTSRFMEEIPEGLLQKHFRAAVDMVEARVNTDPPKPKKKRRGRRPKK